MLFIFGVLTGAVARYTAGCGTVHGVGQDLVYLTGPHADDTFRR